MGRDRVEYWLRTEADKPDQYITAVDSHIVPRKGEKVNILKITYVVVFVSYALDYTGTPNSTVSACVALKRVD